MSKKKEKQLIKLIHDDTKLSSEEKMMYAAMAELYLSDIKNNLNETSIGLNEKYGEMSIDDWRDFTTTPVIRKYIKGFRDEHIEIKADSDLMKGDQNAVRIKKAMEGQGPAVNNSNIVLIRVPEKVDFNATGKDIKIEGI